MLDGAGQPTGCAAGAGRYAPSPSGPLHFGSLVAALASWLHARSRERRWVLRMEDLDPPRQAAGAADQILRALEAFGLVWDGPVLYQSARTQAYRAAMAQLEARGLVFPCACTRRDLRHGPVGIEGPIYPGTCRRGLPAGRHARTWRLRVEGAGEIQVTDGIQGLLRQRLEREVGDFVVKRADGLHAYQLAVVVDDAFQGVTEVVRGADLVASTPRQCYLQKLLGMPQPRYWHVPLLLDARGDKLGKSSGAPPLSWRDPLPALRAALTVLNHAPPTALAGVAETLSWARETWRIDAVPQAAALTVPAMAKPGGKR